MARGGLAIILKHLQRHALGQGNALPDSVLLDRFICARDEAAFELLVWRHAALVQNVCQRLLPNQHDVEDAFQATFAALACKARSIRTAGSVAPWLHKVAFRAALRLRSRQRPTVALTPGSEPLAAPNDEPDWRDLRPALDAAVQKLASKYRDAFVLCCLEGLTHGEAAARLGCPEGTIHSRLATAKERLRHGLERRGITLSGTGMAFEFAAIQTGGAPTVPFVHETILTAFAATGSSVGAVAAKSSVLSLTRGVLLTMWIQSYAIPAMIAVILGLVGIGVAGVQNKNSAAASGDAIAQEEPEKQNTIQAGKTGQSNEAAPTNKIDLAKLRVELKETLDQLDAERQKAQSEWGQTQAQLSRELITLEKEAELSEFADSQRQAREKKLLAALEAEEASLLKDFRNAAPNHTDWQIMQLKEVQKAIDEKMTRIMELERSIKNHQIKTHFENDRLKNRLAYEKEQWLRTQARFERRIEQLQSREDALATMQEFPQLEQIRVPEAKSPDIHRLENKLDQMQQALEELKKRIDKP